MTTREAPAMAALLLAGRVYTMMPVPLQGETIESLRLSLEHAPRYRRLLNNWLLLAPLFDAGVIATLCAGDDPAPNIQHAAARIGAEGQWEPLRQFAHGDVFTDPEQYLDTLAADLLKGGPDPGIALPACAGFDAFASGHDLPVIRAGHAGTGVPSRTGAYGAATGAVAGGSLAQQVESRLGEPLFTVGLPILKQAGARSLVQARLALKSELSALREAIDAGTLNPNTSSSQAVRRAGAVFAAAFKRELGPRLNRDDEGGRRLTPGFVSLAVRRVPLDAALISSVAAYNRASGASHPGRAASVGGGSLVTLTVAPLDVEPLR
ncbi:MAG: hypothetical protein K2Q09_10285 [Phycisphaerales bacterium]|nr:hypothetical protein [Phycisphaerales bacterium]